MKNAPLTTNLVDKIVDYEMGAMSSDDMIDFFQQLVDTGMAWQLQGHYGRTAAALIRQGVVHLPVRS